MKPILIIYTGGTIGMIRDKNSKSLVPINFDNIYETVPLLNEFDFPIESVSFEKPIDSSDINATDWEKIADLVEVNYNKYDGFVILHGTDTMAYTASALSFVFNNLSKPIIITGSQLPIRALRSDGRDNLINSLEIAAYKQNGKSLINEVCVYFEDKLFRGNRTTKYSSERFDAFKSVKYPALAECGVSIKYNTNYINQSSPEALFYSKKGFDSNVAILKLYPGITKKQVEATLSIEGLKGVIIESYGAGNMPSGAWMKESILKAQQKGVVFMNVSQCAGGTVEPGMYESSQIMNELKIVNGKSITNEAAICKMMYVLGQNKNLEKTLKMLTDSLKGEM